MKIIKEKYYLVISLIVLGFLTLASFLMIWFLYRITRDSFLIDESLVNLQITKFNLDDYEKIKLKLPGAAVPAPAANININTNTSANISTGANINENVNANVNSIKQ